MIRSNPTAISLRTSDIKLLQTELDRRKTEREAQEKSTTSKSSIPKTTDNKTAAGITQPPRNAKNAAADALHAASGQAGGNHEAFNAGEEMRRNRQGQSVADRIGL